MRPWTRSDDASPLELHDVFIRHPEYLAKDLPVVFAEQRRWSIGAERSIREARDGAWIEMRPDDRAIDRDEILTALDLRIGYHSCRRVHRRDQHARIAKTPAAIVGAQRGKSARELGVERILVGLAS